MVNVEPILKVMASSAAGVEELAPNISYVE
jgi:hypothetical protein